LLKTEQEREIESLRERVAVLEPYLATISQEQLLPKSKNKERERERERERDSFLNEYLATI